MSYETEARVCQFEEADVVGKLEEFRSQALEKVRRKHDSRPSRGRFVGMLIGKVLISALVVCVVGCVVLSSLWDESHEGSDWFEFDRESRSLLQPGQPVTVGEMDEMRGNVEYAVRYRHGDADTVLLFTVFLLVGLVLVPFVRWFFFR
jgi:hypothetical protein